MWLYIPQPLTPRQIASTSSPSAAEGANGADHLENGTGRLHLDQLPNFVEHLWRTPGAADAERGSNGTWQPKLKAGNHSLRHQTDRWATPRVTVRGPDSNRQNRPDAGPPTIHDQASAFSLPDRPISTVGEERSHIRRTLNPLFVEWLMGWPPGWTCLGLTPPASTASACSATALCRWKALMRSALSQLASPPPAAPAQLALFA